MFVSDTVQAFIAAMQSEAGIGEVVNFGTGYEVSIGELVGLIAQVMDVEVSVDPDPARVRPAGSEIERLCASNAKARRLFGWAPRFEGREGLRRGLSITAEWFRAPCNLARYNAGRYHI